MNYTVRPLTNETKEIFTEFLGNVDFSYAPHWATCFCRFYFTDCDQEQWMNRTGEDNRLEALKDFQELIALPVESKQPAQLHYRGTMNMYLENGFKVVERHDDVNFMILDLKKN